LLAIKRRAFAFGMPPGSICQVMMIIIVIIGGATRINPNILARVETPERQSPQYRLRLRFGLARPET